MMALVRGASDESGNTDIYLSQWDGRLWSRPVALASINPPANDVAFDTSFPYLAAPHSGN